SWDPSIQRPSINLGQSAIMRRESQFAIMRMRGYDRLVMKNGKCNVVHSNVRKRKRRYFGDIFTTLVDMKWRYCLAVFFSAFFSCWLLFTFFWWALSYGHGDYLTTPPPGFEPCLLNVNSFLATLLFSMETQITIGYGSRSPSDKCPIAVLLVTLQSYGNLIITTLMTGAVLAKLTKSKNRTGTLLFSKNAAICSRDGHLVLLCRVGDARHSHLIDCSVRGVLVKRRLTAEGETLLLEQQVINMGLDGGDARLFLGWPVVVQHRIDSGSPFWNMSAKDLYAADFELLVFMNGVVISTGATTEARTSYLPTEIRWGHRFEDLSILPTDTGECVIDYEGFHDTVTVPGFPRCSALELARTGLLDGEASEREGGSNHGLPAAVESAEMQRQKDVSIKF
ncbi:hypothetical protein BOX15_Mlig033444g2, partial [Macrostomum lignano]